MIYLPSPHFSYERFASLILISAHCLIQTPSRIIISAITLRYRCPGGRPPPAGQEEVKKKEEMQEKKKKKKKKFE